MIKRNTKAPHRYEIRRSEHSRSGRGKVVEVRFTDSYDEAMRIADDWQDIHFHCTVEFIDHRPF